MDYGKLLSRAWNIVWNHKFLFILGFLAALGSGGEGPQYSYRATQPFSSGGGSGQPLREVARFLDQFGGLLLGLLGLALLLGLCVWLLGLIAEAGMIASVDEIDAGGSAGLGHGFRAGISHLSRMIGMSIILYGPVWLIGALSFLAGLVTFGAVIREQSSAPLRGVAILAACLLPLVCLAGIYSLAMMFIFPFAQRSIVLKKLGPMAGIRDGWGVLRAHLGDIVLLALLFMVLGFFVGVVAGLVVLPLSLVTLLPAISEIVRTGTITSGQIVLSFVTFLAAALLSALIASVLRALRSAAFTLAYKEFTQAQPAPVEDAPLPL